MPDFTDDILGYLRARRGGLVGTMKMIDDLTARASKRRNNRGPLRGKLLSDLNLLIRQKKVIRYRKTTMVRKHPRSSQGLVRISELFA